MVQIDTLDVAVAPGARFPQFTLVSTPPVRALPRYGGARRQRPPPRACSGGRRGSPSGLKSIQADGGSEFKASFGAYYQERGAAPVVLPLHSPRLNGTADQRQPPYHKEIYACVDPEPKVEPVQTALHHYEPAYSVVPPTTPWTTAPRSSGPTGDRRMRGVKHCGTHMGSCRVSRTGIYLWPPRRRETSEKARTTIEPTNSRPAPLISSSFRTFMCMAARPPHALPGRAVVGTHSATIRRRMRVGEEMPTVRRPFTRPMTPPVGTDATARVSLHEGD